MLGVDLTEQILPFFKEKLQGAIFFTFAIFYICCNKYRAQGFHKLITKRDSCNKYDYFTPVFNVKSKKFSPSH